jgi:ABC-type glutathione transport system ATPase component
MTTAPLADQVLISVRDLEVRYGSRLVSRIPALDVAAGQCVALVGESGSGKTSALQAIMGLGSFSGARVCGSVLIDGVEVIGASDRKLREVHGSAITLVSQSPQAALNPTMRLGRLASLALKQHGVRGAEAKERIADALGRVVLPADILRRYPHEVSGGQAQRFCIALAVALRVRCIAADEPTSALDVTVQAEILRLLDELRRQRGMAVVLVSHDLALVSTLADQIVVMKDGEVVESGSRDRVLTSPTDDYTRELLAAVPVLGSSR